MRSWAVRATVLGATAAALVGVSASPSSAAGSTCQGPGVPYGPITSTLLPPPGNLPTQLNILYGVTGLLDGTICRLLP